MHRLNRTEYANAIRDLLALEIDGRSLVADEPIRPGSTTWRACSRSRQRLLENYLSAAATVSRLAVGDPTLNPSSTPSRVPTALVQDDRQGDDLPFGSRGGTPSAITSRSTASTRSRSCCKRQLYHYLIGMGEPHQIDVRLDGVLLKRFTVGGEGKGMTAPESFAGNTQGDPDWEDYMHTADAGLEVRVPVKAGTQRRRRLVRAASTGSPKASCSRRSAASRGRRTSCTSAIPRWRRVLDRRTVPRRAGAGDTPSRRADLRLPADQPARPTSRAPGRFCRRSRAAPIAGRSRRHDVATLLGLLSGRAAPEGGFDAGIQRGLERMLVCAELPVPRRARAGERRRRARRIG